jgi:sporulation protein YlmC with PRC-barrel domain
MEQDRFGSGETVRLISSEKVEGTEVYNSAGDHIGEIEEVMIDKYTGKVAYAVLSFGGWLGIGEKYHPLPWSVLDYVPQQKGYVVDVERSTLEQAPAYSKDEITENDLSWRDTVHKHYGAAPYWS